MSDFKNTLTLNGTSVSVVGHNHLTTDLTDLASSGLKLLHGFPFPYIVSLSYSPISRTITLTPSGSDFIIWIKGVKFTKTGAQVSPAHANTTGNYFIYYDESGVLQISGTPWQINSSISPVCYVYYNSSLIDGIALFELHTADRSLEWHESQHFLNGTFLRSGLEISGYTLNTDSASAVTFGIAAGIIVDEDIEYNVNTLSDNGPYFILNRTGATDFTWTTNNVLPYRVGTTYIQYNQNNGGTWQLTDLTSTDYVNYYIFATTALESAKRIIVVPGQAKFTSLTLAQGESVSSINWENILIPEICSIWKLTYQARSTYTGVSGRARLIEVSKLNLSKAQLTGNFILGAHNSLSDRSALEAHPASSISNIPTGNISATDIQAAINELDYEKQKVIILTRTVPIIVNDYVELGNFVLNAGAYSFFISLTISSSGFSISKNYSVNVYYNLTGNDFQLLKPISFAAPYVGMNADLEISVVQSTCYFRLKRTLGTTAGNATISIIQTGLINSTFTETSLTGTSTSSVYYSGSILNTDANDVLTKLKTVDGANSGLDADLLDGNDASVFAPKASPQFTDVSVFTNGDSSLSYTKVQIALSYNNTTNYSHFIHSRHNSINSNNAIDFYTSDGTTSGVFPTNAIHNLTMNSGLIGIGTFTPSTKLHVISTTEQLRLGYDATKYCSFNVENSGNMNIVPTGGNVNITGSLSISSLTSEISLLSSDNILIQKNSETELKKISLNDLDNLIGNTKSIVASENLIAGDFVNIWNDTGTQKVRKSDATISGKETTGFVLSSFTSGQSVLVFLDGINNQCSGLTIGTRYYLSTTPGTITNSPIVSYGSGNVLQYVGIAINTTELAFEPDDGVII